MVSREPTKRVRQKAAEDDDTEGLPALDGGAEGTLRDGDEERGIEPPVELDVDDDATSSLDDVAAGELDADAEDEAESGESGLDWDDEGDDPVDADPSLTDGEEGGWTEGSETSESDPWEEESGGDDERELGVDRGEEGVDDHGPALDDSFVSPSHGTDLDGDADDLDVAEDASIESTGHEASALELPRIDLPTTWLGPPGEAARSVACGAAGVLVGAGGLFEVRDGALERVPTASVPYDGEVTSLAQRGAAFVVGTDAGEVFSLARGDAGDLMKRALPRPGTRDGSLGAVDVLALDTALVARTRGGALFRASAAETAWVGPVVARSVRMICGSIGEGDASEWLLALVGTHGDPVADELVASSDARRFEHVPLPARAPGATVCGMARSGRTVALALSEGPVMLSKDAGATWAPSASLRDAQQVWLARERGEVVLYAALFHEASDRGQLVRLAVDGEPRVVLDVAHEARARRLGGPGDPDGDGRIHALAVDASGPKAVLWIATGVGLFRVEAER